MTDELEDLPEQIRIRREKLERIRASGIDPYPAGYAAHHVAGRAAGALSATSPLTPQTGETVGVTGRVVLNRNTGKLDASPPCRRAASGCR